jgi:hypothetical protein
MEKSFDIFSGTQKNAMWVEVVEGLSNARERMQQMAEEKPGQYFVFSTTLHMLICEIETFAMPPEHSVTRYKNKSSAS